MSATGECRRAARASGHPDRLLCARGLGDDLNTALRAFTTVAIDELPVVDSEDPRRVVAMLRSK